ncbi:hypothetical protein [Anabaena sp. CCY 9910]
MAASVEPDLGIALSRKLVLLTPNHRHFNKIPRLLIEVVTV